MMVPATRPKILKILSASYEELQERTKPIIRKLITVYLIKSIEDKDAIKEYFEKLGYIDDGIVENYLKEDKLPTAKEIASSFGVTEASASRTLNNFLEKIRKNVKS